MDNRLNAAIRQIAVPVLATLAGLLIGALFILAAGKDPMLALHYAADYVAGSPAKFGETLVSTTPLIFTGLAVMLAFRCGLFNIGVEGQYLLGQAATAWGGYALTLSVGVHPAVAMLCGMIAGAAWAGIAGFLKAYRGVHEVISSIMLNYVGYFFTHWLLMYKMRAASSGMAATPAIKATAVLAQNLIHGSRLHVGIFIALAVALLVWLFLWKTPLGYEIRATGFAPGAAEYAGMNVKRNMVLAFMLSGALAGLAASVQTLGLARKFFEPTGFVGFGFDGIAVALVGQNHPLGVVLAALLFGALDRGGMGMQAGADVPKQIMWVVQGTIIFFVGAEGLWRFLKARRAAKTEVKTA